MKSATVIIVGAATACGLAGCGQDPAPASAGPAFATTSAGITLRVPQTYVTVADAVRAARNGDIVHIAAGEHNAGRVFVSHPMTIRGDGIGRTIIRGNFESNETAGINYADLTIVGDGVRSGIVAGERSIIERCEIRGFHAGIRAGEIHDDIVIRASQLAGNLWGILLEDARGRIVNNEVLNNTKGGIVVLDGYQRVNGVTEIFHNTVVGNGFAAGPNDNGGGIVLGQPYPTSPTHNNLVVGNRVGINCLQCDAPASHNLVWGNTENYAGDASAEPGDLSLDPLFVAPSSRDFNLQAGSPGIDAGTDLGVTTDRLGRVRPYGSAPDIGAHEHVRALPGLVINEVMANPLVETTGEFVEIYNGGGTSVDLAGLVLDDGDVTDSLVPFGGGPTVLAAGDYAVVLDPDFAADHLLPANVVRLTVSRTRICNGLSISDPMRLLMPDRVTVVSTYGHPFNPGNGVSAERIDPTAPDLRASWVPSPCGASPGLANCAGQAPAPSTFDLLITEVIANPLDERTGELVEVLNRSASDVDLAGLVLSDGDSDDVLEGYAGGSTVVPAGGYAVILDRDYAGQYNIPSAAVRLTTGNLTLGNSLSTSDPVTLRTDGGALVASYAHPFDPGNGRSAEMVDLSAGDRQGNWASAPCAASPYASPGEVNCASGGAVNPSGITLVINEVMANPLDEDTGEFVEIYNHGNQPVDVRGLVLDDGDATDSLSPLAGQPGAVPAGGYAVVLDPEYAGQYAIPAGAVLLVPANTTLGSGLSTNDPLTLLAPDGVTVVSTYSHPFNPGNGDSVERIDDRGDVPGNWIRSPCAAGSSPGRQNCADTSAPPPPSRSIPPLLINEVMANPVDEARQEFVEILNHSDQPVDVAGFVLSDGDAADVIEGWAGGSTVIPAHGLGLILDRDYDGSFGDLGTATLLTVDDRSLGSGLSTNDPIRLLLADGASLVATYTHPFNPGNGVSTERIDADEPDVPSNWLAAPCMGPLPASPGHANCALGGGPASGQMVDVNSATPAELIQVGGLGSQTAAQIIALRTSDGPIENLEQLTVIRGVSMRTIDRWATLESAETHVLGIDPQVARSLHVYERVADLQAALPDPATPGDWVGRVVRVVRATNKTTRDQGGTRRFELGDWTDETRFHPTPASTIPVYLGSTQRADVSVIDALADWIKEHGAPTARPRFYTWSTPTSGRGRIRANHVFAVEAELQIYNGAWQLYLRQRSAPGMDRLVLYEKWLEPTAWDDLVVIWSYNYKPAVISATGGFTMTLPYRLVLSHPCVAYWEQQTGNVPRAPRRQSASQPLPGAYDEYNLALTAWQAAN